jgi:dimethylaniline monooxygenase (N-oxide forming)
MNTISTQQQNHKKQRVCIIGCGISGCCITRYLASYINSIQVIVFEQEVSFGGTWLYNHGSNNYNHSACYSNLMTNTHVETTRLDDTVSLEQFVSSNSSSDRAHHTQVMKYLNQYVTIHGVLGHVQFNTRVIHCSQSSSSSSSWIVTVERKHSLLKREQFEFDWVIVSSGKYFDPFVPKSLQQEFFNNNNKTSKTQFIHSHDYRTPDIANGKIVCIVGLGTSGRDILQDIQSHSSSVKRIVVSTRSYEKWIAQQQMIENRQQQQRSSCFPLRRSSNNTNNQLRIQYVPEVESFAQSSNTLIFKDNSRLEQVDLVIICTGYNFSFPFLEQQQEWLNIQRDPQRVDLFMHMFHPMLKNMALMGLCSVAGSIFPVIDCQARWLTSLITGTSKLPSDEEMMKHMNSFTARTDMLKPAKPMMVEPEPFIKHMESLFSRKS